MAVQTITRHYITTLQSRIRFRSHAGQVVAFVPEVPGIEAEAESEGRAAALYVIRYFTWLVGQLAEGRPVPPMGEHDLNSDQNRRLFMAETGLTIPLLKEQPDPDQMWFWTPKWQQMEREAEDDIAAGRSTRFENDEEFLSSFPD